MKNKFLVLSLICLTGLGLVSCDNSTENSVSTSAPTVNDNDATYNLLMSFSTYTRSSQNVSVVKDGITYYSANEAKTVDTNNKIIRENGYETKYSYIDEDYGYVTSSHDIYKDGKKSYTWHDDNYYYTKDDTTEIDLFKSKYDLSVLKEGTYTASGYNQIISKDLTVEEFTTFLSLTKNEGYSEITLKAELNSLGLTKLDYSFTRSEYKCEVSISFSYTGNALTLPTNIAK